MRAECMNPHYARALGAPVESTSFLRSRPAELGLCRPGVQARAFGPWAQACWAAASLGTVLRPRCALVMLRIGRPASPEASQCSLELAGGEISGHAGVMSCSVPCFASASGRS